MKGWRAGRWGDGEQKQKKRGKGCKIRGNGRIMGEKGRTKERKG